jgi:hypothetical protein
MEARTQITATMDTNGGKEGDEVLLLQKSYKRWHKEIDW